MALAEPGCLRERSVPQSSLAAITHMLQYLLPRWREVKGYWGWVGLVVSNTSSCIAGGFTHSPVIPSVMYEMSAVAVGSGCVQLRHSAFLCPSRCLSRWQSGSSVLMAFSMVVWLVWPVRWDRSKRSWEEHRSTRPQLSSQSATRWHQHRHYRDTRWGRREFQV